MPSFRYDPENPLANDLGMVTTEDYYAYKSFSGHYEDKRMYKGNEPVVMRFISDSMPPTRHMADGKIYTSKHKFRAETKARGCVEVGNDTKGLYRPKAYIPPTKRKETREHIRQSIRALKDNTMPEDDRNQVRRISEQIDFQNRNRKRK